jgi:ring-1,2-phenylacetyl-CoA epoxidase subunit PaaA
MIMFFVDGAAMRRQASLKRTSWEPYAHAIDKICFEEGFHIKHGEDILRTIATGSRKDQERLQEAFEKWWPRILQFFGPTDDKSTHHGFASQVGLKTKSNDELRNAFLNTYMQKAKDYGLEIPDEPRIRDNGDGTYAVVEDDLAWDEYFTVARNEYPDGVEQINSRKHAQEAVQWVRDMMDSQDTTGDGPTPQAAD